MENPMYDHHLLHPDVAEALKTLRHDLTDAHERLRGETRQTQAALDNRIAVGLQTLRAELCNKLNVPQAQLQAQARETDAVLHSLQLSLHNRIDQVMTYHADLAQKVEELRDELAALDTRPPSL